MSEYNGMSLGFFVAARNQRSSFDDIWIVKRDEQEKTRFFFLASVL